MHPNTESSATAGRERRTRQRAAIDDILDETADFTSAQELHATLRARGSRIGLATVYRTLQAMADDGRVDVIRTDSGESVYRRCGIEDHHHHLVCRSCGAAVEIARPAVEAWADRVAAEHGYVQVTHTVELFGRCPRCAPTGGSAPRTPPNRGQSGARQ